MDPRESMSPQPIPNDRLPRAKTEYHYEHEDSREIYRDIERTRSLMDETIDELTARLQPAELIRGIWAAFRSSSSSGSGGTRERVSHAASSMGRAASSMGHSVSSGVSHGMHSGAEKAAAIGHSVSSGVRSGSESIAEGVQEGTEAVIDCVRRNPVPSALVGAGLGYFLYNEFLRDRREELPSSQRLIMQGYTPQPIPEEDVFCEPAGTVERSIVLPAGSDIESPKYPLQTEAEARTASDGASFASQAGQRAKEGASAVGGAASSAASSARDAASSAGHRLSDSARHAASSASHAASSAGHSMSEAARHAAASIGGAASSASHAAATAGRSTYGAMRGTGRSVSHAASATYEGASHGAATMGEATVEGLRASGRAINKGAAYTRDASREATEQYPLLVGLGCLGLGMLAGFLLPRTRREDEAFGETAEEVRHRGYEMGTEAVERGKTAVSTTAAHAMEQAEKEGLTPSALADHAGNVVKKVAESAKQAMHEEGLTSEELAHKAAAVKNEAKETAKHEAKKETSK